MKEQDMIHKLVEEEIEIPESIKPENIYRQLLQMDEGKEQGFPSQKQREEQVMRKKIIYTGTAVAAGLLICVLAAVRGPVGSTLMNTSSVLGEVSKTVLPKDTEEPNAEGIVVEQDYQSVFRGLQKIVKHRSKMVAKSTQNAIAEDYAPQMNGAEMQTEEAPAEDSLSENSASTSETNVRTQGVDEGDIVKTDGEYIYAYRSEDESHCYIYHVNGEKTKKVATISVENLTHDDSYDISDIRDMYLSEGKLVLVTGRTISSNRKKRIRELYQKAGGDFENFCKDSWGRCYGSVDIAEAYSDIGYMYSGGNSSVNYSCTLIYDISDPTSPVLEKELFQDGVYESSRIVDGKLYLMSSRYINIGQIDYAKEKTFVPQIGGECVTPDKVDIASENEEECYQVLSSVDVASGDYIDKKAVLGGGSQIYVSQKSIYLMSELSWNGNRTILMKYSYKDGELKKEAEGKIQGYLKDDYSVDEEDGYLRAVTTYSGKRGTEKNAVYVLNSQLKKVGEIKDIAPKESVYAVRFMGDLVYFVTFEQTDPVFVADLSKPTAPKIIGELKLPGFSSYLHPIGEDLMVGIGMSYEEEEYGVKLSLFDTSDPKNIKEIHKTVLTYQDNCEVINNPNALFVDADRQLLGFSVGDYEEGIKFDYMVYQVDREKGFVQKCKAKIEESGYYSGHLRGLYIDDYFYIVNPGGKIKVYSYPEFKKLF